VANNISPTDLQNKKNEYVILDVRESSELYEGKIDGAITIPLGLLIKKVRHEDMNEYKDKKIVTFCNGGYRGNIATDELNKQGFNAINLEGGYNAWKESKNK
jgi:rhodanese-related sulfurtransferase